MAYSYSIDDPAKNSKRTLAFILTVLIHVFFFWVLASGLGAKMVQTVMGPVETKMIEELPDDDKEPPFLLTQARRKKPSKSIAATTLPFTCIVGLVIAPI